MTTRKREISSKSTEIGNKIDMYILILGIFFSILALIVTPELAIGNIIVIAIAIAVNHYREKKRIEEFDREWEKVQRENELRKKRWEERRRMREEGGKNDNI